MQRQRYQGRSHAFAGTAELSPPCRVLNAAQGPPLDNADHGSSISVAFLVLCYIRFLIISLPTTPSPHLISHFSHHLQSTTSDPRPPCNSPPPSSPSPQVPLSPWPKSTLPSAPAVLPSAASLTSLTLLPSAARTVRDKSKCRFERATYVNSSTDKLSSAPNAPQTLEEFDAACGETGVTAQCCVLPIVSHLALSLAFSRSVTDEMDHSSDRLFFATALRLSFEMHQTS
jgi:hypothetical protein